MSEIKIVEVLVSGGEATAGPPLGPTLGPLGLNVLAVVNKINELTKSYAGMKVPVKVEVNLNNKQFEVSVGIPTTSALIVRQLGISKGSGMPNVEKVGNLSMEQVVMVVTQKQGTLLAKNSKGAAKEVLGSCASMGVTVDGKEPTTVQQEIDSGMYDEFLRD
ncbi:MAG: 50S ribosomal protein L11 [Candidatus Bathyarchaeota archaeon]|jgi:large subunit ribosomal protein L11|nr:50S ribosomal protein L11 [Candidatus Bathyarchaeota archaeon]